MKRLYERSSRRSEPGALDPEVRAAIAAHAQEHLLGNALGTARWCCVTRSVRLRRPGPLARLTGSGDPDGEHTTVALLLPTYLVVAVAGKRRGVHVRSIWLGDVVLDALPPLVPDTGISATGPWSGMPEAASFHLALGGDAAGKDFLTALRDAVTAAKSGG